MIGAVGFTVIDKHGGDRQPAISEHTMDIIGGMLRTMNIRKHQVYTEVFTADTACKAEAGIVEITRSRDIEPIHDQRNLQRGPHDRVAADYEYLVFSQAVSEFHVYRCPRCIV